MTTAFFLLLPCIFEAMKIYTKTGDKGQTSLIGGKRVPKYHDRIEAYGTVDELNSYLGYIACVVGQEDASLLLSVQERLFTMGALLASAPGSKMIVPDLKPEDIFALENRMDQLEEELTELRNFILPGGSREAALCHVARCVCRRTERLIIRLGEQEKLDEEIIPYINRLSDYLFVLARKILKDQGITEIPWTPRS